MIFDPDCTAESFETIIHTYGSSILRIAYSYLRNPTDAEDVLQDTLLQYLKSTTVFESDEHRKSWLLRVAINLCKNRLKSHWRYAELTFEIPDKDFTEEDHTIIETVWKLPIKYREVIHLYYFEGYSTQEISVMLQKNESTIRSLMRRARLLLKEDLKGAYDFYE